MKHGDGSGVSFESGGETLGRFENVEIKDGLSNRSSPKALLAMNFIQDVS